MKYENGVGWVCMAASEDVSSFCQLLVKNEDGSVGKEHRICILLHSRL